MFNVPMGESYYIDAVLKLKGMQVSPTTNNNVTDLANEHPKELWTMLQFSLQHKVRYWLRTRTPEETKEIASHVDACIMEAVEASTSIDFDEEEMTEERLRLPTRMKGGGIKKLTDLRRPAFLGALLDILPRCIDITESNRGVQKGYYSKQLTWEIGYTTRTAKGI